MPDTFTLILLTIILVEQIGDFYTTYRVIRMGGVELNPVVRWLLERLGLVKGLFVAKIVVAAVIAFAAFQDAPHWLLAAIAVGYGAVLIWNARAIRKQKQIVATRNAVASMKA